MALLEGEESSSASVVRLGISVHKRSSSDSNGNVTYGIFAWLHLQLCLSMPAIRKAWKDVPENPR